MATVTWTPDVAPGLGATTTGTQNGSLSNSDTYRFLNDGKIILSCDKGANTANAVLTTPATERGLAIADVTYALAASTEDQILGPFPPDVCNDASGYASLTFSEVTGLTVTAIRLP